MLDHKVGSLRMVLIVLYQEWVPLLSTVSKLVPMVGTHGLVLMLDPKVGVQGWVKRLGPNGEFKD